MVSSSPAPAKNDPFRNPSYPERTHFGEKKQLEETLRTWEQRIETAAGKLLVLGTSTERAALERLFHQALGAARSVGGGSAAVAPGDGRPLRRGSPSGFEMAESALVRLTQQWEAAGL